MTNRFLLVPIAVLSSTVWSCGQGRRHDSGNTLLAGLRSLFDSVSQKDAARFASLLNGWDHRYLTGNLFRKAAEGEPEHRQFLLQYGVTETDLTKYRWKSKHLQGTLRSSTLAEIYAGVTRHYFAVLDRYRGGGVEIVPLSEFNAHYAGRRIIGEPPILSRNGIGEQHRPESIRFLKQTWLGLHDWAEYDGQALKGEGFDDFIVRMSRGLTIDAAIVVDLKYDFPRNVQVLLEKREALRVASFGFLDDLRDLNVSWDTSSVRMIIPFAPESVLCIKANGKWRYSVVVPGGLDRFFPWGMYDLRDRKRSVGFLQ
jgi:hypothetical protein